MVVANPPYMGSSSFNPFVAKWIKKHYPDSCRDLCTAFIERGMSMAKGAKLVSMITASSWMFISSFETFRKNLLSRARITSMIQQSTHGFPYVTVPTTMFVLQLDSQNTTGCYIRLEDFDRPQWQRPKALEAVRNPDCGWFYRADASTFHDIPGSPIAYWASEAMHEAFKNGIALSSNMKMPYGFKTGDNDKFLRLWWECPLAKTYFECACDKESASSGMKWFPYNKGGQFRKWYGNNDYLLNYENKGHEVLANAKEDKRSAADYDHALFFTPVLTWSRISSGRLAVRFSPRGSICDMTGPTIYGGESDLAYRQALLNSTIILAVSSMLSPTLDFQPGQIASYPLIADDENAPNVNSAVAELRLLSRADWDSQETSWDFKRNPLV